MAKQLFVYFLFILIEHELNEGKDFVSSSPKPAQ